MAINPLPPSMNYFSDDEEYIDIEVSSCSFFSLCPNSSTQNKEIEFQMASITNYKKESTTSFADELFFKGRVIPLHQKILQKELFEEEDCFSINFLITPNGSPSQSCKLSFELNPNDHKISPKKLWYKLIKHSLITQKFKASRAFLKSLFTKSSCSNGNCCSTKNMKKTPFKNTTRNNIGSLSSIKWQLQSSDGSSRSFSSTNSSSTCDSFSSSNSCSFYSNSELSFLKRSNNLTSDIDAAVAHCKKSQHFTIPTIPNIAIAHS